MVEMMVTTGWKGKGGLQPWMAVFFDPFRFFGIMVLTGNVVMHLIA